MKHSTWYNCYDETLKAFITPESFAHPAKMAKRLCERIIEHGEEEGYWRPGDVLIDPFGGIGTTGLIGAYRGYRVISLELEPRFIGMQQDNIKKNAGKLTRLGQSLPVVIQGDARRLSQVISEAIGSIFSPPRENGLSNDRVDPAERVQLAREMGISNAEHISAIDMEKIGKRPKGYVSGSVTNPPYADGAAHTGGDDKHPDRMTGGRYIGVGLNGAISSPPYSVEALGHAGGEDPRTTNAAHSKPDTPNSQEYGETAGQIGAEAGETYWQAMRQVYGELYKVIRPGGVAAIVIKNFIRNKQIVPLCDMTAALLEFIGFEIVERTYAMLVKEETVPAMFAGHDTSATVTNLNGEVKEKRGAVLSDTATKRIERKSFFRRLAESKGSPRIDYEQVIWAQKPGKAAGLGQGESIETTGAITSPPYADSETRIENKNRAANLEAAGIDSKRWLDNSFTWGRSEGYGETEGQIGTLKEGDFEQAVKGVRGE